MSQYCYVDAGVVVSGPQALPVAWLDPDTGQLNTNLRALSEVELRNLGWYPYVENDPGSPGDYYYLIYSPFDINPTNVSRDVSYVQWDIEDVRSDKNSALEAELVQYTTNEQAINPKVADYINDDAKWLADEQARLARLDVWQDVADFITTKPPKLVLPNSYVGGSYVRQGVALTAQNTAAVDSGLAAPWDQTLVNNFISQNQTAAEDPSDTTPPVQPGYQLRQGVAVPSEQFNRVVIYRFDRDDPNPALQRSFAMQMSNRQDARPLYVFTYTGLTYLAWHLFEDQGNGIWSWEAFAAEMQYTDTDMGFIFSYGTNPAVEADFFTDRVEFPAGVDQQNLLVAWDPV